MGLSWGKAKKFVLEDLWHLDIRNLSRLKAFLLHQLRVLYLIFKGFIGGNIHLQASWLTYMTLLCIGPFLAFVFSLAKTFGVQDKIKPLVINNLAVGRSEIFERIFEFVEGTSVATLGTIGFAVLVAVVINMMGFIERALNDIWGIRKSRNILQKFRDYISVGIIFPILLLAALGISASYSNVFLISRVKEFLQEAGVNRIFLNLTPYLTVCLAFSFVYTFLPNTRVQYRSALVGALVSGTIWQVWKVMYVHFQIGMARFSDIYGVFASFPIFLIWLYFSWTIVLFGSEVSFAHQNAKTYRKEGGALKVSYRFKEMLGLRLTVTLAENFLKGEKPCSSETLSRSLNVPVRLINEVLYELTQGGILVEVKGESISYQPSRPAEKIKIKEVLEVLRKYGEDPFYAREDEVNLRLASFMEERDRAVDASLRGKTVKDLAT